MTRRDRAAHTVAAVACVAAAAGVLAVAEVCAAGWRLAGVVRRWA